MPGVIAAALLRIAVASALWWSYFDWVIYVAQARLSEMRGAARAAFARDAYSYLHLPVVAGIVLFAFGLETTLHEAASPLPTVPALGLFGGIALYLLAHVALRLRTGGGLGWGRPVATVALLGLFPMAGEVPALTALVIVAAVCASLIGYEVLRHRGARLDPQPPRRVHHGRGFTRRVAPPEGPPSSSKAAHVNLGGAPYDDTEIA